MKDDLPSLTEPHRRQLLHFSRWLAALADAGDATLNSVIDMARQVDRNGIPERDRTALLEMIDSLLAECWDRRPDVEQRPR